MSRAWLHAMLCLAAAWMCAVARAQESVTVQVRVVSVTSTSCYLDKGETAGLVVGDRVSFTSTTGLGSEGTLRAVSKNNARAEIDSGAAAVKVGDSGRITIPRSRLAAPAPTPPTPAPPEASPQQPATKIGSSAPTPVPATPRDVPDHPAWSQPPEAWTKDQPLLAPAFGIAPEDRASTVHGRAYVQTQGTWDQSGTSRRYANASSGFDTTIENPFGAGGSLRTDVTLWTRSADAEFDNVHSNDTHLRIDRLVYDVGGTQDVPTRWQFGRFLQGEFPELGVLDGVEWDRRLERGSVIGASAGAMPEPSSTMTSFEDQQIAAWYRHAFDVEQRTTLGIAYQNTWHSGTQDRNLFVLDASVAPAERFDLRTTALVDWYGPSDTIKDDGFELTEFIFAGTWSTTEASGIGLAYSHRRIPEMLRSEFFAYDADSVRHDQLDRVVLNGWMQVSPRIRIDARADRWTDEDDSGSNFELGTTLRNLLWSDGDVRASVFHADGTFSSGPGVRLAASKAFGRSSASLGYELVDFAQKDFTGEQSKLAQQVVFGSFDTPLTERLDLSVLGERRFGDEQDAYTLGVLLQWRF